MNRIISLDIAKAVCIVIGSNEKVLLNIALPFIGIWFVIEAAKVICKNWIDVCEGQYW